MHLTSWSFALCLLMGSAIVHGENNANDGDAGKNDLLQRGSYLVSIMDCTGCHTGDALRGAPDPKRFLAGSDIGFATPEAIVYPPNLTPDLDTGLGRWTDDDIVAAIKFGKRPDGRTLSPAMPWPSYSRLSESDARAITAYLRSIPAVAFAVPSPVMAGGSTTSPYLTLVMPEAN